MPREPIRPPSWWEMDLYSFVREMPLEGWVWEFWRSGSGRHIAALHAMTSGVVNEIIAHAVAAAHFDKDVDTIFEIGGQDAKYTHLTNGIASDYAMNEACSAGTGSFLEESARETLNICHTAIADIAFTAEAPLNFNDQSAAFISSDIKTASHEGSLKEDIVAGLVYSICMNYVNRVKGNRPVGKKVFMQGGVCYNRAVPYAMSNLINKEIIVPPEPGLMGAFGVALEIKNRINLGFLQNGSYNLDELITRRFSHEKDFICMGGSEQCDRKCKIALIKVEDRKYPFGGACRDDLAQRTLAMSEATEEKWPVFLEWLIHDFRLATGQTPIARVLAERGKSLAADERGILEEWQDAIVGLHEVVDLEPGKSLTLRNVFDGRTFQVSEVRGSLSAARWDILSHRIIRVNGEPQLSGLVHAFHAADREKLVAHVTARYEAYRKGHPAATWADFFRAEPLAIRWYAEKMAREYRSRALHS